jgi:hypothetical protein
VVLILLLCKELNSSGRCAQVARDNDEMEVFSEALGSTATQEDNAKIAGFFEAKGKAGQVCVRACACVCVFWHKPSLACFQI